MNEMVDIFDNEYGAGMRKKRLPELSLRKGKKKE